MKNQEYTKALSALIKDLDKEAIEEHVVIALVFGLEGVHIVETCGKESIIPLLELALETGKDNERKTFTTDNQVAGRDEKEGNSN